MTGVDWPPELGDRTPAHRRARNRDYSATLGRTTEQLETELSRLDPDDWQCSTGNQHTKSNGLPLHNSNPDDPAFVLQWSNDGDAYAVGCDRYSRLRDNIRTVYLWFHETRMRSKRSVSTAEAAFAAAKLPPADEDAVAAPAARSSDEPEKEPHQVLGISPDASPTVVKGAARALLKEDHPDHGGNGNSVQTIQWARDQMLDGGVATSD